MNKKKRILNRFTNWLFNEYKVSHIPVRILYQADYIIDNGMRCYGYYGIDNGVECILIAGKKLGTLQCMFTIAHEFVHYMQRLSGISMDNIESIEKDAYFYEVPLVGKYIINHRHIGERINNVLDVTVPSNIRKKSPNYRREEGDSK